MQKPITIRHAETLQSVARVLNESELPFFVQVDILEDLLRETQRLEQAEYARDMRAYKEAQDGRDNEQG